MEALDGGVDPFGNLVLDVIRSRPTGDDGIEAVEFVTARLVDGGLIEKIPLVLPDAGAVAAGRAGIAQIGDETSVTDTCHGLLDGGMFLQQRFDFSQLDAETTDLDLMVHAAEAFERTVGVPTGEVTGAIEFRSRAEWGIDETIGGQLGKFVVTG